MKIQILGTGCPKCKKSASTGLSQAGHAECRVECKSEPICGVPAFR